MITLSQYYCKKSKSPVLNDLHPLSDLVICHLPAPRLDVLDHGAEGVGVHVSNVDLTLSGLPHARVQHGTEDQRQLMVR